MSYQVPSHMYCVRHRVVATSCCGFLSKYWKSELFLAFNARTADFYQHTHFLTIKYYYYIKYNLPVPPILPCFSSVFIYIFFASCQILQIWRHIQEMARSNAQIKIIYSEDGLLLQNKQPMFKIYHINLYITMLYRDFFAKLIISNQDNNNY